MPARRQPRAQGPELVRPMAVMVTATLAYFSKMAVLRVSVGPLIMASSLSVFDA